MYIVTLYYHFRYYERIIIDAFYVTNAFIHQKKIVSVLKYCQNISSLFRNIIAWILQFLTNPINIKLPRIIAARLRG